MRAFHYLFLGGLFLATIGITGSSAYSQGEVYGTLSVVKGKVDVISGKDHSTQPAKGGGRVYPGDSVVTGADSRAKITMVDTNVINISPDTKMAIEQYVFDPKADKRNVSLAIDFGKVRSTVNQKYDGEQNTFHVRTPSAVAGVRGTDFLVSFDRQTQSSQVVTFRGQVEVGATINISGRISSPVRVNPGQATSASAGNAPSAPAAVAPQILNNLNRETVAEPNTSNSTSNSSSTSNGRSAASTTSTAANAGIGSSASAMAPTTADMTNTSPAADQSRVPASTVPSLFPDLIIPTANNLPIVNPDLIKNANSHLTINIK